MTQPLLLDKTEIASLCLHDDDSHLHIQLGQTEHRIDIVQQWAIAPGDNVLELGCGQGDTTAVLATAVGELGHVTALDPADLDYGEPLLLQRSDKPSHFATHLGSPFTLGQAQSHLKNGPLGSRIDFIQADPIDYLRGLPSDPKGPRFTHAILAHCIFYFASPAVLEATLSLLAQHAKHICIAEYALVASQPTAHPHLLAVLTQASLECRKPVSSANVRTVLSPEAIKGVAATVGLKVVRERTKAPPEGMYDGRWEVGHVLQDAFAKEVHDSVVDERERGVVLALRDAVNASRGFIANQGLKTSTMDVWVATLSTNV